MSRVSEKELPGLAEVPADHWLLRPLQRLFSLVRPGVPSVSSYQIESTLVPPSTESGRQRMFENVQIVLKARNFLRNNPSESLRIISRAGENPEAGPTGARYHKDVVAVWEYLERKHELEFVDLVFHVDGN